MFETLDDDTAVAEFLTAIHCAVPGWTLDSIIPLRTVEAAQSDRVSALRLSRDGERRRLIFKTAGTAATDEALTAARREIRLLTHWHACGLPVPRPLASSWRHGWLLLEHIPGPTAWHRLARPVAPAHRTTYATALVEIGETLARFHLSGERLSPGDTEIDVYSTEDLLALTLDKCDWIARHIGGAATAPLAARIAYLRERRPPEPTFVLCHGDLSGHNILFPRADRVILIDWSEAFFGPPAFDLAYLTSPLNGLCVDAADTGRVLQGYRSHAAVEHDAFEYHVVLDDVNQTLNGLSQCARRAPNA